MPARLPLCLLAALAAAALFAQTPLIDEGRAALSRGDSDAAIGLLEKAVAQSSKSAEAHFFLGSAYANKAGESGMFSAAKYASKVKEEFGKAVALNPKYVEARYGLVQLYAAAPGIMGGSFDKAFEQAKEIKALDPIVGHRAYAFIYSQQKKPDLAKKEYADAIREQPDSPKAHNYLGQYLVNVEKDYAAAFAEFETALKLDPNYMPAFYHVGRTAALGEKSPALKIEQTKTSKADLTAALKDAFAYCDKAYDGMTDASATQVMKLFGGETPKLGVLIVNNTHAVEHYGNLVTYMRLKNIVPPTSEQGFMPPTKK
jgi:tetratricopeptide (TPR) repeat protein